ncbi:hypothetical protein MJM95_28250, partial [Salmonella enterica subsp. enterica serovar Anatum]|nr:hypothetical protein [Salmonella enterica subsp. enterica serovar Anatum]
DGQFKLPKPNVPDCSFDGYSEPERAARAVRESWGIGELSISNIQLSRTYPRFLWIINIW